MTAPVRRLNDRGRQAFRAWLGDGATGTSPLALLDDPTMSNPLRLVIPRPDARFESRYDLGAELVDLLDVLDVAELQGDTGLGTGCLFGSSTRSAHQMKPGDGNPAKSTATCYS
jgi:hypothetical protein